jgi:hypothetical protein
MRRRITKAFFATAAAGATITTLGLAASPAGAASTGHKAGFTPTGTLVGTDANCPSIPLTLTAVPSDNCGRVGYQASGRTFRFAQALITVPNHLGSVASADPTLYVALDNSGTNTWQYTRVGIAPCPAARPVTFIVPGVSITCPTALAGNTSGWVAFVATADAGVAPAVTTFPIGSSFMGDGVLVNAYLVPTGNSVQTTITMPNGTTFNNTIPITGPVYTKAQATADWTTAVENGATEPQPAVPAAKIRDSQFFQGRFTTMNGNQGTFNGPWTLNAWEATSNGSLPPAGTLIGSPSFLWNDGSGFNGMGDDAFGVWRFPF